MTTESAAAWFARFPDLSKTPVFTLRVKLSGASVTIRAYEGPFSPPNHTTLFCECRVNGKVLFSRESSYVGIPGTHSIDSDYAKETVLALFALKPGDTDPDFFAGYTADQLDFVRSHGDEIGIIAEDRYGTF